MKTVDGHTEGELWIAIRQERSELQRERHKLVNRLAFVTKRLEELAKAENILEGGL